MIRNDFNSGWTVRPLSRPGEATPVTLPHDAMREEPRSIDSMGEGNIGWYIGGDYEYRKTFQVPADLKGQELILEFESVYKDAEVTINGEAAPSRSYGYTQFEIPLGSRLLDGENEIRVIAKNSDQPNSRWYSGTGIFRPVWLLSGPKAHILPHGVRIKTLKIKPEALIKVSVSASMPGTARILVQKEGQNVAETELDIGEGLEASAELAIPDAALWSPESPSLYTLKVLFGDDVHSETFGIRILRWDARHGLTINGKRILLKGACIHHDNGILGAVSYPEAEERRIRILKENGYNAVRSAHNPASVYLLNACDKLGVLMMDEYVDVWYMHKTRYDYADKVQAN